MSTRAEYLQKYITEVKKKKLRKKSKVASVQSRIHIIDDDATTVIETKSPDSEEEFGEEAPQIADVIDESSNSQKMQAGKWKTIADTTESCHRNRLDSDSDLSPPRNDLSADKELSFQHANFKSNDLSKKDPSDNAALYAKSDHHQRKRLDSDSDLSPPRPQLNKRESDCDLSPPRSNSMHVSSPKRALTKDGHRRKRLDSDSDLSPPRSQSNKHKRQSGSDLSPPRSNSKHASSPKRALTKDGHQRKRLDSDSDLSPPRSHSDKHKRQSDSDLSPPRLNLKHANSSKRASTEEIPRKKQKHLYSDISPTKHKLTADETAISRQKHSHETSSDSDLSPLRTNSKHTKSKKDGKKSRHLSIKSEKKSEDVQRRVSDKKEKTVGEKEETKEKQSESNNSRSTLSNTATAKSEEDCSISFGNDNEPWVPELFKPLARYRDDPELDEYLKKQERSGDTMLEYIRGKQRKEPSKENIAHPVYKGPPPPPNRFNIMPGYRWDGVDRSNGFEKRYFDLQAKKKSQAELAYKWSVENM